LRHKTACRTKGRLPTDVDCPRQSGIRQTGAMETATCHHNQPRADAHWVRSAPECVAKLDAGGRARNIRIRSNLALNQYCVFVSVLESMLLILVVKIVLQHIPPNYGLDSRRAGLQGERPGAGLSCLQDRRPARRRSPAEFSAHRPAPGSFPASPADSDAVVFRWGAAADQNPTCSGICCGSSDRLPSSWRRIRS